MLCVYGFGKTITDFLAEWFRTGAAETHAEDLKNALGEKAVIKTTCEISFLSFQDLLKKCTADHFSTDA